jgi:hypothetical protein
VVCPGWPRRSWARCYFRLDPDVFIALDARAKKPGEAMVGEDVANRIIVHDGRWRNPTRVEAAS